MLISKNDFQKFEAVRKSGKTNIFDVSKVQQLSGLDREMIFAIMSNYAKLCALYPEVRKLDPARD